MNNPKEQNYWSQRYRENRTGWDIGYPATPIKEYIDQLKDSSTKILIPGAGNAYEAEYLWQNGYRNVYVMDISKIPLLGFQQRNPSFPRQQLLQTNFFQHEEHYDLILEQTFFCSFVPTEANRNRYAEQMAKLLKPKGKLVGVWFDIPLTGDMEKRPFGGDKELYLKYLTPYFEAIVFERCQNSIPPRMGTELFGIFQKK